MKQVRRAEMCVVPYSFASEAALAVVQILQQVSRAMPLVLRFTLLSNRMLRSSSQVWASDVAGSVRAAS